jgi:hemerythrin-like metal-binding protein
MEFINDKHIIDNEEMDNLHKEFVDIYNSLQSNDIEAYKNVMAKLLEQTKRHFCQEEQMMEQFDYPRKREHIEEHQKVLAEMEYFINKSNTKMGQMMLKSYYNEKLSSWFDLHLISMDSDLSAYIRTKSL